MGAGRRSCIAVSIAGRSGLNEDVELASGRGELPIAIFSLVASRFLALDNPAYGAASSP